MIDKISQPASKRAEERGGGARLAAAVDGSADIEQWFIRLLVDEIVNLILRLATPNRKC